MTAPRNVEDPAGSVDRLAEVLGSTASELVRRPWLTVEGDAGWWLAEDLVSIARTGNGWFRRLADSGVAS